MRTSANAVATKIARPRRSIWRNTIVTTALVLVSALACGATPTSAHPQPRSWAGWWVVNFAKDLGGKRGGADVIWKLDAGNEFELTKSTLPFGNLEVYQCGKDATVPLTWKDCLFIRVGTKPLQPPNLKSSLLPVAKWDASDLPHSANAIQPIADLVLGGLPQADTERLIGWTADWVARSMPSLGKPTKYEVRDGRY